MTPSNIQIIEGVIIFLIGIVSGMYFHRLLIQSESKKKNKRTNPDWCGDRNNCQNHVCKSMPNECEYDLRDLL